MIVQNFSRLMLVIVLMSATCAFTQDTVLAHRTRPDSAQTQPSSDSSKTTTPLVPAEKPPASAESSWPLLSNPLFVGIVGAVLSAILTAFLTIHFQNRHKKKVGRESRANDLVRFLRASLDEHEKLPLIGFDQHVPTTILLRDIVVELKASLDFAHEAEDQFRDFAETPLKREPIDIHEAFKIAESKNLKSLIVKGDPGSGKTTLLRMLALGDLEKCFDRDLDKRSTERSRRSLGRRRIRAGRIPIFLPLRSWRPGKTLAQNLSQYFLDQGLQFPEKFFDEILRQRACVLLFDGLDEVPTDQRVAARNWLETIRTEYPGHWLVISSRFNGYVGDYRLRGRFVELALEDFSEAQIRLFLRNWYIAVDAGADANPDKITKAEASANRLAKVLLEERADLMKLWRNPLTLQITAIVDRYGGGLPERRAVLYERCTNILLDVWEQKRLPKQICQNARLLLQPMAFELHEKEQRQFDSSEAEKKLADLLKHHNIDYRASDFLKLIRDSSWSLLVGFSGDQFGFIHHSIQEYLTAEEIRRTEKYSTLCEHFGEDWWREPTLLFVGLEKPCRFDKLAELLLRSPLLLKAPKLLEDCIAESAEPSHKPFLRYLQNGGGNADVRVLALQSLEKIRGRRNFFTDKEVAPVLEKIAQAKADLDKRSTERSRRSLGQPDRRTADLARRLLLLSGAAPAILKPQRLGDRLWICEAESNAEYILLDGGVFTMGDDDSKYAYEKPAHPVKLTSFYLARYPVTNKLYRLYLKENSKARKPQYLDDKRFGGDDQPAVGVSWNGAVAYIEWLNEKTGRKFSLPTEAQWEFAARGTPGRKYPWGNEPPDKERANFNSHVGQTTSVSNYPKGATPEGVFDLAGNAWEWCQDWFGEKYYAECKKRGTVENPTGPIDGGSRVLRGGSWGFTTEVLRSASRYDGGPGGWSGSIGFRVVLSAQS